MEPLSAQVLADRILDKLSISGFWFEQDLEKMFFSLDANGSGYLEPEDMETFLLSQGYSEAAHCKDVKKMYKMHE